MTRRNRSRRSARNWSRLELAVRKQSANPSMIAVDSAANSAASFRREWPRSVKASTTPALTMPMQISSARSMARIDDAAGIARADRSQNVARENRRRVAGKSRGIGREITQKRRDKGADRAPQRKSDEKADPVLTKQGGKNHDADRSDNGSDQSERGFAQRGPQHRRADDRGCRRRPRWFVELKLEGDISARQTDAHILRPKRSAGVAPRNHSAKRSAGGLADRGTGRGHGLMIISRRAARHRHR